MKEYVPDFFYTNALFIKYGALWPPTGVNKIARKLYTLFKIVVLFLTLGFSTFSVLMGVLVHIDDLSIVIEVLNVGVTILLGGVKTSFWLNNEDRIKRIMETLETAPFHYEEIDNFDPRVMIQEAKTIGIVFAWLLMVFSHLVLGIAYIPIILISLWYYFNNLPITGIKNFETLPYYIYVPIEHNTPMKYICACLMQVIPCYLYVNAFVGIDSLFMNMMNLIATHILVLQGAFRTLRRRCLKKLNGPELTSDGLYNSDELEEYMMDEIKKCVQHLQLLFGSCKDIEEVFKYVTLAQALGTIYILCTTLLLLTTTPVMTKEFGKNFFYLIGVVVQLGLYCWFGNQLTLKATNLPLAVWESEWLQTRKPYKICMFLTMLRLKKPLYINAGQFVPLTLETQIAVLRGSYSYYSVLKGMSK